MNKKEPDILNFIANISNQEVFTSPKLANEMLDMLPKEIWKNREKKFLDPCSKTGIFLREIVKRLLVGLEEEFPNLEERIDHIMKNQIYGIAISKITFLVTKRTVYCSKKADGPYSVTQIFNNEDGNIIFKDRDHTWKGNECTFCGLKKKDLKELESEEKYAFDFIHGELKEVENMEFDVIIGNPPYNLGGKNVGEKDNNKNKGITIYHKFIENAKKMNPKNIVMIIPSRWQNGGAGKNFSEFRENMLKDRKIKKMVDYPLSKECFPEIDLDGGVMYFHWERDYCGDTEITVRINGKEDTMKRALLEEGNKRYIRFNQAIGIIKKINEKEEKKFSDIVESRKNFGLESNFDKFNVEGEVVVNYISSQKQKKLKTKIENISKSHDALTKYKVFLPKTYGNKEKFPEQVINTPFVGEKMECCTDSFLMVGGFENKKEAENVVKYMKTKFFRFLLFLLKTTKNNSKEKFEFIPIQDFKEEWLDEKLYEKYKLTKKEIQFIEYIIADMPKKEDASR